jgi:hypothetical protein
MFRTFPWPFPDDRFPDQLGAVVMKTVASGDMPALQVLHDTDNGWAIADGMNDPNQDGACLVTHIRHVISYNSSIEDLATIPPGTEANRRAVGEPWVLSPYDPSTE